MDSNETQRAIPLPDKIWSRPPSAQRAMSKLSENPELYKTYLRIINYSRRGEAVVMSSDEIKTYLDSLKKCLGETDFEILCKSSLKKALRKFYAEA